MKYAKNLEGKKISDIGDKDAVDYWLSKRSNKGGIGNAIQVCYFGIPANSIKEADFNYHNLELKVTPIKQNKNKSYSSKERLVLSIINYETDWHFTFELSPLMMKSSRILLIFYLHEDNINPQDYKILKVVKFSIPYEDIPTIKEDYNIIIGKIKAGQAHKISESDTTYLAASTKGAGKEKDWRKQPFSNELAKQRAFSFKAKYMTSYFNSVFNKQVFEKLHLEPKESLSSFVHKKFKPFIGLTTEEIEQKLNFYPTKTIANDKGYLPRLVGGILNIKGTQLDNIEQFQKGNIKFKTIRLRKEKSKNQDMSFPNLNFDEILNVSFEESTWYEWFAETKYLFVVFEDTSKGTILKNQIFWNMPYEDLQNLEKLYNHIKHMLINNEIKINVVVNEKSGKETWFDNLPKKNFVPNFQIRPKGTKQHSFTKLPDGRLIKKKCLFLNKEYIHSILDINQN
ncbi:DNA mismatch repair protein MutH [Bacillus sp. IITD106]|nr:DNA mismatch repair protein MutH [Bacillus sp. IITD106]